MQFVADVECSTRFPAVEHLYTQSLFLGANTTVPQPVDVLLRLENITSDLASFKQRIGYRKSSDLCPLRSERSASQKPRAVPSGELIRR